MFRKTVIIAINILLLTGINALHAQDKLYKNEFYLGDVKLLDGPFKHAQDLNVQTLLKYDINRFLAPYMKAAGLKPKAPNYPSWESMGLDGHMGGHYLSAMAINWASTGNIHCKQRMDSMIVELKKCQDANSTDSNFVGYVGGVPNGKVMWLKVKNGDPKAVTERWVPWYNVHKMYAGLRDAWLYGGNDTAKAMFLKFCDWGISICANLSPEQMQVMLQTEQGGMNEMYADAYQMTGDKKYLDMSKRFSDKVILNSMAKKIDNLDNKHANTQVPKAIGFARIAEESHDPKYVTASKFFWQTVTQNRTLAFGGNSRREFFPPASSFMDYITSRQGPESCNTYNMLKLTEDLFRMHPEAQYADYYERAVYNHILSTQNPVTGGYVYFTPARPEHYRVYSVPNEGMWCCVGTGMENHGKYGEFIYTHNEDTLFLNLFIASELNWKDKGVKITQNTHFPDEDNTKLTVNVKSPTAFKLMVRHPFWVTADAFKIVLNGDTLKHSSQPSSYAMIDRTWKDGDVVKVILPMRNRLEELPNVPTYVAVMHGPILLGAVTGTQDMTGLFADSSRWAHIPNGPLVPLTKDPIMIGSHASILSDIYPVKGKPLTFKTHDLFARASDSSLVLKPFFRIYDARYMMYWLALNKNQYKSYLDSLSKVEQAKILLDKRTIDEVTPGQQQPEVDHLLKSKNSETGVHEGEFWRHARDGGYISYTMRTNNETNLSLMVRYWGNEFGSRQFDILIDGKKLVTENIGGKWNKSEFENVEYPIPDDMVKGKKTIEVRFQAAPGNYAGGLYNVRILRND